METPEAEAVHLSTLTLKIQLTGLFEDVVGRPPRQLRRRPVEAISLHKKHNNMSTS